MINEFHITGPPGTGKTSYLAKQVERAVEKHGAENVIVASYTKAAASELNRRQLPIPRENVGTLHALCYRALCNQSRNIPEIAEVNAKSFNEEYPHYAITPNSQSGMDEMAVDASFSSEGDAFLNAYNLQRAKCLPLELMNENLIKWVKTWERWKTANNYVDFADMISLSLTFQDPLPGNPRVGIFDECFPFNVCVTMSDGSQKSIGNIVENKLNGSVLSFNEQTGFIEEKKIVGWHKIPLGNRKILTYGPLQGTENHPIFTKKGYQELQKVIDLNCMEVLYLDHEKLQSERSIDAKRKVYNSRITSWRCFGKQKQRVWRQCKDQILSGSRTSRVSSMEVSKFTKMGANTTLPSAKNRIRRFCFQLFNFNASRIYKILESNLSRRKRKTKKNYTRINRPDRSSCFSSMVYGRWIITKRESYNKHLCSIRRGFEFTHKLSQFFEFWLQCLHGKIERTSLAFQCSGNTEFSKNSTTIYSSDVRIQNLNTKKQTFKNILYSTKRIREKSKNFMSSLWNYVCSSEIPNSLRKRIMPKSYDGSMGNRVKNENPTDRSSKRDLRSLWGKIFKQEKESLWQQTNTQNLQQTLQVNSGSYVYCIDVEDNHNFFANNILVHNCQDFNRQELNLIRHWSQFQDYILLAGDPDQSIYDFAGSDPEVFSGSPVPQSNKRLLKQSWRLPRKVHEYSQKWIRQIKNREDVEFNYKQGEEGSVSYLNATYKTPDAAIELAERYARDGKTVMLLTSCSYMLDQIKAQLRGAGLPFFNPYRAVRGDWNPLGNFHNKRAGRTSTRERLLSFLNTVDCGGKQYWSIEDLASWLELVKTRGILKKGAKEKIELIMDDIKGFYRETDDSFYKEIFEDFALEKALQRDLPWFMESLLAAKKKVIEYPLTVYRKHGRKALEEKPKIIVGTIHSTKGGEADVTILFPDLSLGAMEEYQRNRDSVIRTFYVGMTRAKESLILCKPRSSLSVKFN